MRRSKAETAASRRHILEQASRLFRERGPERVSVADVMEAAGMTHGGFYKHFESKEALFAATLDAAFAEKLDYLDELSREDAAEGLRRYLDGYLTEEHVEDRASGCPIAGLASDALRGSPEAVSALSEGAITTLKRFATATACDGAAIRALSLAVGALVVARSIQDTELRSRVLRTAAKEVGLKTEY